MGDMSLAGGRAPRKTAGNRLSGLLEAEEEDEFYQTTYGGFTEARVGAQEVRGWGKRREGKPLDKEGGGESPEGEGGPAVPEGAASRGGGRGSQVGAPPECGSPDAHLPGVEGSRPLLFNFGASVLVFGWKHFSLEHSCLHSARLGLWTDLSFAVRSLSSVKLQQLLFQHDPCGAACGVRIGPAHSKYLLTEAIPFHTHCVGGVRRGCGW